MASLLVTNDFPPKIGGIQTYLHELWRRLPPTETTVLTTPHRDASAFDAAQAFRMERVRAPVLLPTPGLAHRIDRLARDVGAAVVFLDPMLPLGAVSSGVRAAPRVVVAHGAEVTVYGRLPLTRPFARRVLRSVEGVVAAGHWTARQVARVAGREVPTLVVPPGVDAGRFRPLDDEARRAARAHFGVAVDRPLVLGVSRLVPRKGFDVLLDAVRGLDGVQVVIAGAGRDRARLERRAAPISDRVHFLGRVDDEWLPALYGCADVFAMPCRDRWGALEAEGFGIVFLEAAAAGVPAVAGRSGGAHEAVVDGVTGFVVDPTDVAEVRAALARVLGDAALAERLGHAARARASTELSYEVLARRLAPLAAGDLRVLGPV